MRPTIDIPITQVLPNWPRQRVWLLTATVSEFANPRSCKRGEESGTVGNRVSRISVGKLAVLEGAYGQRSHSCSHTRGMANAKRASQGSAGRFGRCLSIIATRRKNSEILFSQTVRQTVSRSVISTRS